MEIKSEKSKQEIVSALDVQGNEAVRLGALWKVISSWDGDNEFEEAKNSVQWGIDWNFNIEKVIGGHVIEYPNTDHVKIKGYDKLDWNEYKAEVRKREKLMRNILNSQIDDNIDSQEEWYE